MALGRKKIEQYVEYVRLNGGTLTALPMATTSSLTGVSSGAATSGGNTTPGVVLGSTTTGSGVGIYFGAGAPTISAPQGSLYLNTTGSSTSTRAYINTNGTTGWTAVTTAA